MENNNSGLGSDPQEVMYENLSLGTGVVPTGNEIMQSYPSECNKIFTCSFCSKQFSTPQGLGSHMNMHKKDQEWETKREEMERKLHLQWLASRPSQDALSNDNHLGTSLESFKRRLIGVYPSFSSGLTDMNTTVAPQMTPTCFFTRNTFTSGSSSGGLGPRPPYNNHPSMFPRNVDNIVEIDDDVAADTEEGTRKSWGADLSL